MKILLPLTIIVLALTLFACNNERDSPEVVVVMPTPEATIGPAPTYTPQPTYTPAPTYTPYPTPVPMATVAPPTYTPQPTYTPYPTPVPTATPEPTHTPVPTPTLIPQTVVFPSATPVTPEPTPIGDCTSYPETTQTVVATNKAGHTENVTPLPGVEFWDRIGDIDESGRIDAVQRAWVFTQLSFEHCRIEDPLYPEELRVFDASGEVLTFAPPVFDDEYVNKVFTLGLYEIEELRKVRNDSQYTPNTIYESHGWGQSGSYFLAHEIHPDKFEELGIERWDGSVFRVVEPRYAVLYLWVDDQSCERLYTNTFTKMETKDLNGWCPVSGEVPYGKFARDEVVRDKYGNAIMSSDFRANDWNLPQWVHTTPSYFAVVADR